MNYLFPFQLVEKDSELILYGAGTVGLCFYKQLEATCYARVKLWVDKNWENCKKKNLPVNAVEDIQNCKGFDYIIIAIDSIKIADEVRTMLINAFGIEDNKIIFSEKYKYEENRLYRNVREEREKGYYKNELLKISPKEMLRAERLDLIVRYLLAKDIIHGIENKANLSLYSRMILTRNNAFEGEDYFSDYTREGTSEYINALKTICICMRKNGFDESQFIPVGQNGVLLNGSHRTGAALALEKDIWIKRYQDQSGNVNFGIQWFEENGFNTEDKIRILRGYADLYEHCGIMLLFGSCMEQWDYLQMQLAKQMTVVGTVELDFSDNYIAFENLFREIYSDPLWRNVYIDRKVALLKMSPLKMRVLLVSDEGFKKFDLYKTMSAAKLELRDRMYFDTDIAPIVMHGSDSQEEFEHLKRVVLSANNLKHLSMRIARNYSEEFVARLDKLKQLLSEKGIRTDDVCISGSSGMEILGLRKAQDIDFFVAKKYREIHGDKTVSWTDHIEYVRLNSIKTVDTLYEDDLLINDDNYHYIFNGLKFVNWDIVAGKKRHDNREKDVRDIRLFELFKDYAVNFENKTFLKQKIESEFYKKR